ncbi:HEAT repeat domain-containing protein [Litoribrevibacter euphylliae]|uniref:HEAT repeat domain-containing protein n=1 Tax=Litoribrevibacter euphylliae TaxID=1834034 RepID=A0ABV7HFD5_9GAMM
MTKEFNLKYENNSTPSVSIVEAYRKVVMSDDFEESLSLVHYRGGEEEFRLGKMYANSNDPIDRAVGADILGQLGWQDRTYLQESLKILISLLDDSDEFVIFCACCAIGHRGDEKSIGQLIRLAGHKNSQIRYGVTTSLSGLETKEAIDTIITLSKDPDRDVRNWAMFGLGTQIEADTPEIRQALIIGVSDNDSEIRGEALVGLAVRKDSRVINLILNEWKSFDDISVLSLEAAEEISSPRLYSKLIYFSETLDCEGDGQFELQLQCALEACQPKIEQVNPIDD